MASRGTSGRTGSPNRASARPSPVCNHKEKGLALILAAKIIPYSMVILGPPCSRFFRRSMWLSSIISAKMHWRVTTVTSSRSKSIPHPIPKGHRYIKNRSPTHNSSHGHEDKNGPREEDRQSVDEPQIVFHMAETVSYTHLTLPTKA